MDRNVTALYRTFTVADLVRREIEALGVSRSHIHLVPDQDSPVTEGSYRDDTQWTDRLHDLHLPDDDVRTYQHAVRRGDYVVSANVDDAQLERVKQIMRRPEDEAHNLDTRHEEFRNEAVIAHTNTARVPPEAGLVGRRDAGDPYVRTYRRDRPITDVR